VNLTYLNLSRNELVSLPPNIASLPNLRTLNLAENKLTSFDFIISQNEESNSSGSFFAPTVIRASEPFPKLQQLDLSHNSLVAVNITYDQLPQVLEDLNLSYNQLAQVESLIAALSKLPRLLTLDMGRSKVTGEPFSILSQMGGEKFVKLRTFKLLDSKIPEEIVREALPGRSLVFDIIRANGSGGSDELEVILNPPVIKEAWELEAERRLRPTASRANLAASIEQSSIPSVPGRIPSRQVMKEDWEIEAEQGLLTEGAKRRLRAAKQTERSEVAPKSRKLPSKLVEKEQWEIDAEQGLLTEGAKRRARITAAARASEDVTQGTTITPAEATPTTPSSSFHSIASYYNESRQILELPSAIPRPKTHARAMSLAPKLTASGDSNPLLPDATLPLSKIITHTFASKLRILTLSNRRMNTCFELPSLTDYESNSPLPMLDELNLVGCNLSDSVPTTEDGSTAQPKPLLNLIAELFPSLSVLDVSQNSLTTIDGVESLFIPDWDKRRKGLKVFKAQGNRIANLDSVVRVCEGWKGDAKVDGWRLEEIDLRDNEVQKLPPELGLLPLDVLLVEGNV
jgi:Leucine-rich repeat (LRR) protein